MHATHLTTSNPLETEQVAQQLAKDLKPNSVLLLFGNLGAGKTTFVRGLARGLAIDEKVLIHSPSFTLIHEYPGKTPLYHLDLYRLENPAQVLELGIEEYLERGGVVAVEWPERALELFPEDSFSIWLVPASSSARKVSIYPFKTSPFEDPSVLSSQAHGGHGYGKIQN